MKILGVSAYYHDSAAALIVDGKLVAAAQEERFSRIKFDASFPVQSLKFCLESQQLNLSDIDAVVYYEKPFYSFDRLMSSFLETAPQSLLPFLISMPIWVREKLNTRKTILQQLRQNFPNQKLPAIKFSFYHFSHAASAYYPSPFSEAAILCLDGVGEWATATAWYGVGHEIKPLWQQKFPHSLGLLYSAFTSFCGFKVNSGEYKLMGLAPYGKPIYLEKIKSNMLDLKDDGSFRLNMRYFPFLWSLKMHNKKWEKLFGCRARGPESEMLQIYKDLAASIQKLTEEIVLKQAYTLKKKTGAQYLCLSGGCALNCVANGVLHRAQLFKNIWVQPAAGDAGGAVGAAYAYYYSLPKNQPRVVSVGDAMHGAQLGPAYSDDEILELLKRYSILAEPLMRDEVLLRTQQDLKNQKVIGWFQGRSEFGPRALGNRSILGDPRSPTMQKHMNLKIKFRESFRPFAPLMSWATAQEYFENPKEDPYMLFVSSIKKDEQGKFPAVIHVDGTARLQIIPKDGSNLIYDLLAKYEADTGCGILINTSFNTRGEPIVNSPFDALRCFVRTDIDSLCLGSFYLTKEDVKHLDRQQPPWKVSYELD